MKNRSYFAILITIMHLIVCCSGSRGKSDVTHEPPKPPVDEDILDLVPYETDVVTWIDLKRLRSSPVWGLVENILNNGGVQFPESQAIKAPLISCDEMILAFYDSEAHGNQLLVLLKGNEAHINRMLSSFVQPNKAVPVRVGPYNGWKTPDLFLLSITKRTIAFGNETIVRMSAKTTLNEERPLRANPHFKSFTRGEDAVANFRYRSGLITPALNGVKTVVPRFNPDVITGVDAEAHVGDGFSAKIVVETVTQMDASVMARNLKKAKDNLQKNMFVLLLGIGWIMDRVEIMSEKTSIDIDLTLDGRDINELGQLVERLQKIRELLNSVDQGMPMGEGNEGKQ